jgi:tape measure domain-containing protein
MSDTIDNKVVSMKFDNKQFEQNIQQTMASLQKLQDSLSKAGEGKGLSDIQKQADKLNFEQMGKGIDGLSAKFVALSTVAITALANITNRAVDAGINIAKSLTIGPIGAGFSEYELTIGSIQTMLANTARYGTKLPEVTKNLEELNAYADKTIYNFGDMTRNIGLFTNAGIRIGDATKMIQGFSNVAAASGTSSEGAAAAAYQLSQALSTGEIRLMDWKSLTNVGMGNKNMQDSLIQIAGAMGTMTKAGVDLNEVTTGFNKSLEKGWLTTGVMEKYLKIMAGDVTPAQMKAIGLTDEQIKKFQEQQKTAEDAATKVRTFTQLRTTITESIGSGWSETFRLLIGDFNEATTLWTSVNDALGPILSSFGDARNKLLKGWDKLGGRKKLIEGIGNAFTALMRIVSAVQTAFQQVFPPKTAKDLFELTRSFKKFTEKLKMGAPQLYLIKEVIRTFFTVIKTGLKVLKGLASLVTNTFKIIGDSVGDVDGLTYSIADLLDKFNDWVAKGRGIEIFFSKLRKAQTNILTPIITAIVEVVKGLTALAQGDKLEFFARLQTALYALSPLTDQFKGALSKLADVFQNALDKAKEFFGNIGGPSMTPITNFIDNLSEKVQSLKDKLTFKPKVETGEIKAGEKALGALKSAGGGAKSLWDGIISALQTAERILKPLIQGIGKAFKAIGQKLVEWAKELDFTDVMLIINAGLIYGVYRLIKKFYNLLDGLVDELKNLVRSITGIFDNLTRSLKLMQTDVKANIILKIAIAVGVLAASLWVLGNMDSDAVMRGLAGIAAILGLLSGVMLGFLKMADNSVSGLLKLMGIGAVMVSVAGAVLVMAGAVALLGQLKPEQLATGIAGLGAILGGLLVFVNSMKIPPANIMATAAALVPLAIALSIFAGSVFLLGSMKPEVLAQGLAAVGAILVGLSLISKLMSGAVGMIATAAGMVILAGALIIFAGALKIYGEMDPKKTANGLVLIGTSLLIMVAAMYAAEGMLPGAAALIVASTAILILAKAMEIMGKGMTDREILRGIGTLLALTGVLAAFGAVAYVFGPALLLLAAALVMVGGAMLIAGIGMSLFGAGLALVAKAGQASIDIFKKGAIELIKLIPELLSALAEGVIGFVTTLADNATQLTQAFSKLIGAMLDGINDNFPKFREMLLNFIDLGIEVLGTKGPDLVNAGMDFVLSFLQGLRERVPLMTEIVGGIIVEFIKGLGQQAVNIADAGTDTILRFLWAMQENIVRFVDTGFDIVIALLEGLRKAVDDPNNTQRLFDAGYDLAGAVVRGMVKGLASGPIRLGKAGWELGSSVVEGAADALDSHSPSREFIKLGESVNEGFAIGLRDATSRAEVKSALIEMNKMFAESQKNINEELAQAQEERQRLLADGNTTYKELAEVNKKINALETERNKLRNTRNSYNKYLDDERAKLLKLAGSYEFVTKKLEQAQDKLQSLRDDKKSKYEELFNQYNTLPDISKTTGLQGYIRDVKAQTSANDAYKKSLDQLRKLGLDDSSYKKLLAEGVDAQGLVNQLAGGGKTAIAEFNKTNKALESSAKKLATTASNQLYDAGIRAAEGLVAGLKSQQKAIDKEMDRIANYMVSRIKKGLGIKSPSQEFIAVAKQIIAGLAKGLADNKDKAGSAIQDISDETLSKMQEIIARIRKLAEEDVSAKPVIAPVVDLTDYRNALKEMDKTGLPDMSASASAKYAKTISAINRTNAQNESESQMALTKQYIFNQTNNSPESLSTIDIYRQSKNLISQTKATG